MPIRVAQHFKEEAVSMNCDGDFTEVKVTYVVTGTGSEEHALSEARKEIPDVREGVPLEHLEIASRGGEDTFFVEATYKFNTSSLTEDDGEATVSFDCGGGTLHMTHSYSQKRVFGTKDAGGAIGWNGKSGSEMAIAGIDVPTAQLRETYTKVVRLTKFTTAYKRKVANLVGKVNASRFKGWQRGEVMFLGMSYSAPAKRSARVSVTYHFAVQPNEDVSICGKKVSKKGFEYAWGLSKTEVNEDGVPEAKVEAIYVDEVCKYESFSFLGI